MLITFVSMQLAALRYNRVIEVLFNFNDGLTTEQALQSFTNMKYDGSGTFTGNALEYAARFIFGDQQQNRKDIADLAIVLTDGKAQDKPEISVKVRAFRNSH